MFNICLPGGIMTDAKMQFSCVASQSTNFWQDDLLSTVYTRSYVTNGQAAAGRQAGRHGANQTW